MDLDREVRAVNRSLGCIELRDRGLGGARLVLILEEPGAANQQPPGVPLDDHVGDHLLNELEARDRNPELAALLRILDGRLDAALADPHAAGRHRVAA